MEFFCKNICKICNVSFDFQIFEKEIRSSSEKSINSFKKLRMSNLIIYWTIILYTNVLTTRRNYYYAKQMFLISLTLLII